MKNEAVVMERVYKAPLKMVWDAITDLSKMKQWYFPMLEEFQPEVGFETRFDVGHNNKIFVHIWKVKAVEPLKKISYEWRFADYPGDSVVTWELFPDDEGTRIVLTHTGTETFRGDLYPDLSTENFVAGWTNFVGDKLKNFVEAETEVEN